LAGYCVFFAEYANRLVLAETNESPGIARPRIWAGMSASPSIARYRA
jgi:hypothetical protein